MISRHWRGLTKAEYADAYVHHLRSETFPSLHALPGFAGEHVEVAVVPRSVRDMMIEFDHEVRHYDVVGA